MGFRANLASVCAIAALVAPHLAIAALFSYSASYLEVRVPVWLLRAVRAYAAYLYRKLRQRVSPAGSFATRGLGADTAISSLSSA